MVMWLYNPLSQQEEEEIDERFTEAVDTLEITAITAQRGSSLTLIADTRLGSAIEISDSFQNQIYKKNIFL